MSLVNQMLKDIDKRHAASAATPAANHDLQGVMRSEFPWRGVLLGGGLVAVFAVVGVVVLNGKRALEPIAAKPVVVLASAPVQMASAVAPVVANAPMQVSAPAPVVATPAPVVTTPTPVVTTPAPVVSAPVQTASPVTSPKAKVAEPPPKVTTPPPVVAAPVVATAAPAAAQAVPKSGSVSRVLTAEQRAENLYRDAVEHIRQGRISQAQDVLKHALSDYPLHHPSRQLLARSLVEAGQVDEAQSLLREGLTLAPNRLDFYIGLAHASLSKNDVDSAIKVLESGLPVASGNPEFHAFLATVLQRSGRHDEAIQHYVIALRKTPDAANWLLGLAISLQEKKDKASAADAYQRAIDLGLPPSLLQFAQDRLRQLSK